MSFKYKVGDRVKVVFPLPGQFLPWVGREGEVVMVKKHHDGRHYGVDFGPGFAGHNLRDLLSNGVLERDTGWWVTGDEVMLVEYTCPHCKKVVEPDMLGLCPDCTFDLRAQKVSEEG